MLKCVQTYPCIVIFLHYFAFYFGVYSYFLSNPGPQYLLYHLYPQIFGGLYHCWFLILGYVSQNTDGRER